MRNETYQYGNMEEFKARANTLVTMTQQYEKSFRVVNNPKSQTGLTAGNRETLEQAIAKEKDIHTPVEWVAIERVKRERDDFVKNLSMALRRNEHPKGITFHYSPDDHPSGFSMHSIEFRNDQFSLTDPDNNVLQHPQIFTGADEAFFRIQKILRMPSCQRKVVEFLREFYR